MENESPHALITRRREAIEAKTRELQSQIDALKSELAELVVAERVYLRLSGEPTGTPADARAAPKPKRKRSASRRAKPSPKPAGSPLITTMIISSLEDGRARGLKGLTPKEMVTFVNAKWWPGATVTQIGPIAWRMWKQGTLRKADSTYMLPEAVDDLWRHDQQKEEGSA